MEAMRAGRGVVVGRRPGLTVVMLLLAAGAWIAVLALARRMGAMPGTMGLALPAFVGVWTLMMVAMMLPGVAPFASFYTRTFTERRAQRVAAFASGYLLVWAGLGVPAFGLAWIADRLVGHHAGAATALAALVFVACGVYQFAPLKDSCLALCRSPLGFTVQYGAYQGRGRDARAGARHGLFCAGCCWALMALLLAFGLMNLLAMLLLSATIVVEKYWSRGVGFARVVGVVSIALAVVVIVHPRLAPGLHRSPVPMNGAM